MSAYEAMKMEDSRSYLEDLVDAASADLKPYIEEARKKKNAPQRIHFSDHFETLGRGWSKTFTVLLSLAPGPAFGGPRHRFEVQRARQGVVERRRGQHGQRNSRRLRHR